ncbi:MAG: hypothetical protein JSU81_03835 [Candidatus Coatesbacteria bacterium]|nr:MAG: hypothetical protein JSU81_03835 [Candidatus Coatesbacteria bacterium]
MKNFTFAITAVLLAFGGAGGAAFAESTFTSADGDVTIKVEDDGSVVKPQKKASLVFGADGTITRDGEVVGKFVGDKFYDKDGNVRAEIQADGTVVSRRELGKIVGTNVYDADGELVGTLSDTSDAAKHLALMALRRGAGPRKMIKVFRGGKGGMHGFEGMRPEECPPECLPEMGMFECPPPEED